jgi:hypothetical protein
MLQPSAQAANALGDHVDHGRRAIAAEAAGLERLLLRRGVGALTADRHSCADCGRTPLVGERIHQYASDELVCELCRPLRSEAPTGSDCVRHFEHGHTVRIRRAA